MKLFFLKIWKADNMTVNLGLIIPQPRFFQTKMSLFQNYELKKQKLDPKNITIKIVFLKFGIIQIAKIFLLEAQTADNFVT